MDIKRKIARLVMTGYSDRTGDDVRRERKRLKREITRLGLGGFCVFGGDAQSITGLVAELRGAAGHPLLVASDLERGLGQQVTELIAIRVAEMFAQLIAASAHLALVHMHVFER